MRQVGHLLKTYVLRFAHMLQQTAIISPNSFKHSDSFFFFKRVRLVTKSSCNFRRVRLCVRLSVCLSVRKHVSALQPAGLIFVKF